MKNEQVDLEIYRLMVQSVREAYKRAMDTTGYVLVVRDGFLIKLYKDDSFEVIKKINDSHS